MISWGYHHAVRETGGAAKKVREYCVKGGGSWHIALDVQVRTGERFFFLTCLTHSGSVQVLVEAGREVET